MKRRLLGWFTAAIALAPTSRATAQSVTFTRDVAPILFEHCASCHRPDQIAPFSVLSYRDVRPWAQAIARATATRSMPPWKPEPGYGDFVGAHVLTEEQIATIQRWVSDGAIEGDPTHLPPTPELPARWRLGQPDLIVSLPEPYTLAARRPGVGTADGDLLRNFILPIPLSEGRFVRGLEFQPGNARVVHHANMRIDRTGSSRHLDAADPEPGFDGFVIAGEFPDGHFLGWTPGQLPPFLPDGMAWRLDAGSTLVVQLHMQPTDQPELVNPSIGFFFTDRPPNRAPLMLRLGRQNIDIPAGVPNHVIEDQYLLPVDADVYGVQPHAHQRAKEIKGWARLPDGSVRWLIYIKDWDFNWQDVYRYVEPVALPAGATLVMQYTYDNSPNNPQNPDRPPTRVRWGQNSGDEMGDLWIQVLPRSADDRARLFDDFTPKVMAEDATGYETMLQADPRNARLHEAAGTLYLALGQTDRGVGHLRAALEINPKSVEAHYNLGTALVWEGRLDEAVRHFRETLRLAPDHTAAHVNLGVALRSLQRSSEAITHLREALKRDPRNAAAHTNLAGLLLGERRTRQAIVQYRLALETNPDLLEPLIDLAWTLATSSDAGLLDPAEAVRLASRAVTLTGRRDVWALEALAAALAAAGRFDEAVTTQQAALRLAEDAGADQALEPLRERFELYKRGTAFRSSDR